MRVDVTSHTLPAGIMDRVRDYLRLDGAYEDVLLRDVVVPSAVRHVEDMTGRVLGRATVVEWRDVPAGEVRLDLMRAPVASLVSVQVHHDDGTTTALDASTYRLEGDTLYVEDVPSTVRDHEGLRVEYDAGYGAPGVTAILSPALVTAVLYMASHLYEMRQPVLVGTTTTTVPLSVWALINQHRRWVVDEVHE